jgi:hypothetical protein
MRLGYALLTGSHRDEKPAANAAGFLFWNRLVRFKVVPEKKSDSRKWSGFFLARDSQLACRKKVLLPTK